MGTKGVLIKTKCVLLMETTGFLHMGTKEVIPMGIEGFYSLELYVIYSCGLKG